MRASSFLAAALLLAGLNACSESSRPTLENLRESSALSSPGAPAAQGTIRRAIDVRHAGTRLVTVWDGATKALEYRERVMTDGSGEFSVRPIEALTPVAADWELRQLAGEGYYFLYRDFAVHDERAFAKNYRVVNQDGTVEVAGRACKELVVERKNGACSYELAIDEETGLVLGYVERNATGQAISAMVYESFDTDPDLGAAIWFTPLGQTEIEESAGTLHQQLGFEVPLPTRLPEGYSLAHAYHLVADDADWVKLVLTDGVETAFYLFSPFRGRRGSTSPIELAHDGEVEELAVGTGTEDLFLFRMGDVSIAHATLREGSFMAVGRVRSQELVDLIEFALPAR